MEARSRLGSIGFGEPLGGYPYVYDSLPVMWNSSLFIQSVHVNEW